MELFEYYRLLTGRRGLTVQERELIIDRVVRRCGQPTHGPLSRHFRRPCFLRALVAFSLVLISIPIFFYLVSQSCVSQTFAEKGEGLAPALLLQCVGGNRDSACHSGKTLAFKVIPPEGKFFFAAFAKHRSGGQVVWYYPSMENQESLDLKCNSRNGLLDTGVVIGDEHYAGVYDVFGVFSGTSHSREEIRQLFDERGSLEKNDFEIVKASVQIQ